MTVLCYGVLEIVDVIIIVIIKLIYAVRRPPPPVSEVTTADEDVPSAARPGAEMPSVSVEQPPTSTATETSTASRSIVSGLPSLDVQTNPELPSPARVRWMDAFSRVCAHLNQVTAFISASSQFV